MRPTSVAAAALALLCACGRGYTNGPISLPDGAIPVAGSGSEDSGTVHPDAGADGGADAGGGGCVPTSRAGLQVLDGCAQNAISYNGSIDVSSQCAVQIFTGTSTTACNGMAHGPTNAFDGGCGGFSGCSSTSLPGTIDCATPIACIIRICDGGTCP